MAACHPVEFWHRVHRTFGVIVAPSYDEQQNSEQKVATGLREKKYEELQEF